MGAYCVGRVHNMLPWQYLDNGRILCREGTQFATISVFFQIRGAYCAAKLVV